MESYIQISKINDFLYCPMSLYLHSIYESFNQKVYHEIPQVVGKIKHENIEEGTYSTASRFIMALEVSSEALGLVGKIDVYDRQTRSLIERKTRVKDLYKGYKFQLYAQYFCLKEMGYVVEKLFIHSLADNRRYPIEIPKEQDEVEFQEILRSMRKFNAEDLYMHSCANCRNNIYSTLSWRA